MDILWSQDKSAVTAARRRRSYSARHDARQQNHHAGFM